MDAYHEILVKLYEVTGGRDNKSVDLKDLVKKANLHGSYANIFRHLSEEGWIAEDTKADYVRITQWGVAEAKKSLKPLSEEEKVALGNAKKLSIVAKEFSNLATSYENAVTAENLKKIEDKFVELENAIKQIKA